MVGIPVKLGLNAYDRSYSGEPIIRLLNRFVEKTGVNQIEGRSLLARPGSVIERIFGDGPIRAVWAEEGAFTNDLIVVSGNSVYRWDGTNVTNISGTVPGSGDVSMDVASLSDGRRRLFFADGTLLQYYDGGSQATGELTATESDPDIYRQVIRIGDRYYGWGDANKQAQAILSPSDNPSNNETVTIGSKTYTFKSALTPAANEVKIEATLAGTLDNLVAAIIAGAGAGTAYGTGTVAHTEVSAERDGNTLVVTAILAGMFGNFITVSDTIDGGWNNDALFGGGDVNKRPAMVLTMTALPTAGEHVRMTSQFTRPDAVQFGGDAVYEFCVGTPTTNELSQVKIGATVKETLENLKLAIEQGPGNGERYWNNFPNTTVSVQLINDDKLLLIQESDQNGGVTAAETCANASWSHTNASHGQVGSATNPFLAAVGSSNKVSLENMVKLINFTGTRGTEISIAATAADPLVSATSTSTTLVVTSLLNGGTSIVTTITPDPDDFLAWGAGTLQLLSGLKAKGTLTLTPSETLESATVEIGGTYYGWGDVDTPGQAGTLANPWLAPLGDNVNGSLINLAKIINYEGVKGEDFSTNLTGPHGSVRAEVDDLVLTVTAISEESDGNSITTSEVSSLLSWGAATLSGGGTHALQGIEVPGGAAARSVAVLSGFVFVGLSNSARFYWLQPGEVTIEPLDFAEAEFAADNLSGILVVGDLLWLLGRTAIEHWYLTGGSPPIAPVQGRAMANGAIPGTEVKIRDTVLFVGTDGVVYSYGGNHIYGGGGAPVRVSTHAIEERIRVQLVREAEA